MTNRRQPPSSMPPLKGGEPATSALVEGLTMLAGLVGQALDRGTTEISRSVRVPFIPGLTGHSDDRGTLDASLRIRTSDIAGAGLAGAGLAGTDLAGTAEDIAAPDSTAGPGPAAPAAQAREPLVDVFDEGAEVVVTAEVPGCGIDDVAIVIDPDGGALTLTTGGPRAYRRTLALPETVDPERIEKSCKNGMLNVRLGKSSPGTET